MLLHVQEPCFTVSDSAEARAGAAHDQGTVGLAFPQIPQKWEVKNAGDERDCELEFATPLFLHALWRPWRSGLDPHSGSADGRDRCEGVTVCTGHSHPYTDNSCIDENTQNTGITHPNDGSIVAVRFSGEASRSSGKCSVRTEEIGRAHV